MKKILVVDNTIDPPHGSREICEHLEAAAYDEVELAISVVRAPDGKVPDSAAGFDGVVLSGSKTRIAETAPWIEREIQFIRSLHLDKCPALGICYGEQLIVRALGGREFTGPADKSEFGWVEVTRRDEAKRSPIFNGLPEKFHSYEAHNDEVFKLPKGFTLTASSADCEVQAFDLDDAPIWGVQFHPERGLEEGNRALDRRLAADPCARVINRDKAGALYDPAVARIIFRNFLRFVAGR